MSILSRIFLLHKKGPSEILVDHSSGEQIIAESEAMNVDGSPIDMAMDNDHTGKSHNFRSKSFSELCQNQPSEEHQHQNSCCHHADGTTLKPRVC